MSDEKDIITIDEVEYDFAELEDNQQYYVTQLRRLNIKTTEAIQKRIVPYIPSTCASLLFPNPSSEVVPIS